MMPPAAKVLPEAEEMNEPTDRAGLLHYRRAGHRGAAAPVRDSILFQLAVQSRLADAERPGGHELVAIELL